MVGEDRNLDDIHDADIDDDDNNINDDTILAESNAADITAHCSASLERKLKNR